MSRICGRRWARRLQYYRKSLADFPHQPFLVPDPARVAEFRARLAKLPGKKVGICWRSMMLGAKRAKYFSRHRRLGAAPENAGRELRQSPIWRLRRRACARRERYGIVIHQMEGLDLRDDIDGAAALSAALDLVLVGAHRAAATAASVGTEVWFLTAGRTWPQLGTEEYPWYAKTRVLWPEKFGDWTSLMPRVAAELAAFAVR